ncbi:unnamed protein product [Cyprideis torosa]|uniref:Uncharacterized protein n=1 Tax=Cyprideis torosa TaxID=163714 RepID=A0A7R8W664_9CRUS|nr:unnamed protein product [Cyprideis torosa]CAG0881424.1 unnamed protein product [Cyprideis torosa]
MSPATWSFVVLCVFSVLLVTEGQRRRQRKECPGAVTGKCISEELCNALNDKVYGYATMIPTKRCAPRPGEEGQRMVCCERFLECKEEASGVGYRGRLNVTETGKPCLPWTEMKSFHDDFFVDGSKEPAGTYCRSVNFNGGNYTFRCHVEFTDLGCYVEGGDGSQGPSFEFCSLPLCSELRNPQSATPTEEAKECKMTPSGKEYRGRLNVTVSGRTCQRWYRQLPHQVKGAALQSENYPDETIHAARNYCRNPDGDAKGPWCYTTDEEVKWEYCDVPFCPEATRSEAHPREPPPTTTVQETSTECLPDQYGRGYRGTRNVTASGRACRRWDDPERNDDSYWSDQDGSWENYCRSPVYSQRETVWCYTTDPDLIWEYCDVPQCPTDDCKTSVHGTEYQGFRSTTRTGKPCARWDDQRLKGEFMFSDWIQRAEANNYCRNFLPKTDVMPWCMTESEIYTGRLEREYCKVPLCSNRVQDITMDLDRDLREVMTRNRADCSIFKTHRKIKLPPTPHVGCVAPIGGTETPVFEYPFLALIGRRRSGPLVSEGEWYFFCGGTLIASDFIVTAAHCFVDIVPEIVRLREHDIRGDVKDEPLPIDSPVAQLIIHPNYKAPAAENDIALIRLQEKVTAFDGTVRPACLPRLRQLLDPGTMVKAIGWGTVGFSAAKTPVPIEVDFPVWDSQNCSEHYADRKEAYPRGLPIGNVICAGAPGKDTCQGDSGGPLIVDRAQAKDATDDETAETLRLQYELAGITSGGFACGTLRPGVYTRIDSYLEWILRSIVDARKL